MKWLNIISVLLLCVLPALAEDALIYDSLHDPFSTEEEQRIQLHQRFEDLEPPPPEEPEYELMAQPCMGWNFQAGLTVYNADAGRELLLLTSPAEAGGAALLLTALGENASVLHRIPGTAGAWAMAPMRRDRVAVGTYYDGAIHVYDLPQDAWLDPIDIPGEAYVWNLVEGLDGRLYGGTFPGGKLVALDQDSLEIEDCGQAASPNRFLHEVSALPNGQVLCRVGNEAPGLYLYDPESKQFSQAPEQLEGISGGVIWDTYFVTETRVFDASLNVVSPPPFPLPDEADDDWTILPGITTKQVLYLRRDHVLYRHHAGASELVRICDVDLRGGRLMALSVNGGAIGTRGQQYFQLGPGDTSLTRKQFGVASPPRMSAFLKMDPGGQVWGAPLSGQTLFFMDGQTGVFVSMGSVTPRMGRVTDLAFIGHVAYGVSSPGGDIFRLDIEEPWNEWDGENPGMLFSLPGKKYQPVADGIVAAGDNRLLSGWSGPSGGAIAVTNVDDGRTRVMENPVGPQGIAGLALDREFLFAGTTLADNTGVGKEENAPQFVMLGLDSVQPYWNHAFEGAETVNRLVYNKVNNKVAMAVDNTLRIFDINAKRVEEPYDTPPPEITSISMADREDGQVYYGHKNDVVRVNLAGGRWETVVEMPGEVRALTGQGGGSLYVSAGVNVYRIRFPEPYEDIPEELSP